jgi:hypothetical protein
MEYGRTWEEKNVCHIVRFGSEYPSGGDLTRATLERWQIGNTYMSNELVFGVKRLSCFIKFSPFISFCGDRKCKSSKQNHHLSWLILIWCWFFPSLTLMQYRLMRLQSVVCFAKWYNILWSGEWVVHDTSNVSFFAIRGLFVKFVKFYKRINSQEI